MKENVRLGRLALHSRKSETIDTAIFSPLFAESEEGEKDIVLSGDSES